MGLSKRYTFPNPFKPAVVRKSRFLASSKRANAYYASKPGSLELCETWKLADAWLELAKKRALHEITGYSSFHEKA